MTLHCRCGGRSCARGRRDRVHRAPARRARLSRRRRRDRRPSFLGSRATNVRAAVGGVKGRGTENGDRLRVGTPRVPSRSLRTGRGRKTRGRSWAPWTVRVVLGPQDHLFAPESVETFLTVDWKLSPISDRMGCRYIGPKLEFLPRPDYLIEQAGSILPTSSTTARPWAGSRSRVDWNRSSWAPTSPASAATPRSRQSSAATSGSWDRVNPATSSTSGRSTPLRRRDRAGAGSDADRCDRGRA